MSDRGGTARGRRLTRTRSSSLAAGAHDQTTIGLAVSRSDNGTPTSWTRTNTDPAGNTTDRCVWNSAPSELCKAIGTAMSPEPALRTTTASDARNNRTSLAIPGVGTTTYDPLHNYAVHIVYVPTKTNGSQVLAEHRTDHGYDTRHRLISISQSICPVTADTHTCSGTAITTA